VLNRTEIISGAAIAPASQPPAAPQSPPERTDNCAPLAHTGTPVSDVTFKRTLLRTLLVMAVAWVVTCAGLILSARSRSSARAETSATMTTERSERGVRNLRLMTAFKDFESGSYRQMLVIHQHFTEMRTADVEGYDCQEWSPTGALVAAFELSRRGRHR
jgi:hypothetical protein